MPVNPERKARTDQVARLRKQAAELRDPEKLVDEIDVAVDLEQAANEIEAIEAMIEKEANAFGERLRDTLTEVMQEFIWHETGVHGQINFTYSDMDSLTPYSFTCLAKALPLQIRLIVQVVRNDL